MNENRYADILFEQIDKELDNTAKQLRNRLLSRFRDVPWTPEQYRSMQPLIREELDYFMYQFLNSLDNAGCVLPDGVLGFEIRALDYGEHGDISGVSIRDGAFPDYGDMWQEYLIWKQGHANK